MPTSKISIPPKHSSHAKHSLGYLTRIAFRAFSRSLERRTAEFGISSGQWPVLRVLWEEEGLTQRELSRRIGAREPTTVATLDRMERAGLVRRKQNKTDLRKANVYLTPKARRLEAKLMPCVAEVNNVAARGLTEPQIVLLRELLQRVSANLHSEDNHLRRDVDAVVNMISSMRQHGVVAPSAR